MLRCVLVLLAVLVWPSAPASVLWTTGQDLMPAWGFYPNGTAYGGSEVLGGTAAWGTGTLTWVLETPAPGEYHVWVRRYGGYGSVQVSFNEEAVTGGRGGASGARYVWRHLGSIHLEAQQYHLDAKVSKGMLDAVLLTSDAEFSPAEAELPPPVEAPRIRAPRTYRSAGGLQGLAGEAGLVLSRCQDLAEPLNDVLPTPDSVLAVQRLWGAPGQMVSQGFAARALTATGELTVSLPSLAGPSDYLLSADHIDLRVVHLRQRMLSYHGGTARPGLAADLLLLDDRTDLPPSGAQGGFGGGACITAIPAQESRQFYLAVQIPSDAPAGLYRGTLSMKTTDAEQVMPVELDVLPIDLQPVEGWYGIYYPAQTTHPERENHITEARYLAELRDQVRHGCNSATLYSGLPSLPLAAEAGITQPPVIMGWPSSKAPEQVEEARQLGFPDLYYYGVDEPHGDAVERCRKEAQRRLDAGLHMFTAINSKSAWDAVKDVVDRPVLNIYVFDATSGAAAEARASGFIPISYWVTSVSFPRYYRALAGLYSTVAGYAGTVPWGYADHTTDDIYASDRHVHAVSYPDENGQPIPSLRWEAYREGVDDVRYLQALDRSIARTEAKLAADETPSGLSAKLDEARQLRQALIDPIGNQRWFHYLNGLEADTLPDLRRSLAEAILALDRQN